MTIPCEILGNKYFLANHVTCTSISVLHQRKVLHRMNLILALSNTLNYDPSLITGRVSFIISVAIQFLFLHLFQVSSPRC